jgi:D-threonate/D-erythronate kinase
LLLDRLLDIAVQLVHERNVGRLFVEGGGTASALMRRMGWTRGRVCCQYAPGVVGLKIIARPPLVITVKPGSYPWPDRVWQAVFSK